MKTTLIMSLLCIASLAGYAQKNSGIPANAVPAYPKSPYIQLSDPPCYKYINKRGLEIMECPGARFLPEHSTATAQVVQDDNGNVRVERTKSYMGYMPAKYPNMPKNAVPAYPTGPYVQLQDPPCYKYINKRGLEIMECPGARFLPEHSDK